jgi:hypothetical protein
MIPDRVTVLVENSHKDMNTKSPECWIDDPNAHCLRVEVSSDQSLLLPHGDFVFAELKTEGREQQLRLVFATHEVLIRGHCLRRIETAMQRLELAFVAKLPTSQRPLITEGQPVVLEVGVTELNPQRQRPANGKA